MNALRYLLHFLFVLVTETEVHFGLSAMDEPEVEGLWLRRTIEDIDQQESSYILSRYKGEGMFVLSIL